MTVTVLRSEPEDPFRVQARSLRERADSLRSQARQLSPVLATAYRRRAAELDLEAFLVGLQAEGDLDDELVGLPAH